MQMITETVSSFWTPDFAFSIHPILYYTYINRQIMFDKIIIHINIGYNYCRFQVTFQRAVPKFVVNLLITFPSSKIGRELRNKVRKYISMFELL